MHTFFWLKQVSFSFSAFHLTWCNFIRWIYFVSKFFVFVLDIFVVDVFVVRVNMCAYNGWNIKRLRWFFYSRFGQSDGYLQKFVYIRFVLCIYTNLNMCAKFWKIKKLSFLLCSLCILSPVSFCLHSKHVNKTWRIVFDDMP